jgi:PAS domain S-box-containing protein
MRTPDPSDRLWNERTSGLPDGPVAAEAVFREMLERNRQVEEELRRLNATLEQRIAERTAELSASEDRWRTLVENAPEAIVVFDGESGRFEVVNDNAVQLYGRTREELLRLRPWEVSPTFQLDGRPSALAARDRIQEALEGGRPVFDWLHLHSSGRVFTSEVRLVRLTSGGRPQVRASIIDTTERRRREQSQRAVYEISEAVHTAADLSALYARIHGIVRGLMPAENFFIALFDAATAMITFPYYVDELATEVPTPRKISTGLTGLVLRTGKAVLADRAFSERTRREGNRVVVDDGEPVSYIESGRPAAVWLGVPLTIKGASIGVMAVQDYRNEQAYGEEEKRILGYVATQTAVAIERKRSEESLWEWVEKHRALFEASSQGVMLHDEHQFLEVNPAAVRILGRRDASEIVGLHPSVFAPKFQPDGQLSESVARRAIAECLEKGSIHFEWTCLRPDGQTAPIDVLLTRVQWRGRWLMQAMVEDITERKRAEEELHRALAREKELSQLKTSFVSTVSHEFRTPLGIILSSSQILADYFDRLGPAERAEHLDSIAKNTRQMAHLMEEVLVLSRVESGKMTFEPPLLDLAGLCHRLTEEVRSTTSTNRASDIRLEIAPGCGQAHADENLLRHIVTNLISNAVKYSNPGDPVDFEVRRSGEGAVFLIRDRGIGIPQEDREWLFGAFHRGRNVGDRPGSGLGLTIVKRCVELHGGRIAVESEVGRGTVVSVWLPLFPSGGARFCPDEISQPVNA